MIYDLSASTWGPEEIEAIQRVIQSGQFTMGKETAQFEREFADYFGMRHAVMVNSGSSANLIAVAALFYKREKPLQRGDEAIVPAISWSTTFDPLQQYGLKLRLLFSRVSLKGPSIAQSCGRSRVRQLLSFTPAS
jgi:CDP-6-deoxy-D-xylo-4-hexulose-3-dehydrase